MGCFRKILTNANIEEEKNSIKITILKRINIKKKKVN